MIYEIKKGAKTYKVDDNVFFDKQPKAFRTAYEKLKEGDTASFDNADVIVFTNGRVIVTEKESEADNE